MLGYLRQIAICESVRETIRQALVKSDNWQTRLKAGNLPTADYILRAVSLLPDLDTEERLKTFIIKHVLDSLRVTEIEKEQLNLSS